MARISFKLPFHQIRGRVSADNKHAGLILSDHPTQGAHARSHNPSTAPATASQAYSRFWTALISKAWSALDAATAAQWRAFALQVTKTNTLGFRYSFTGNSLFHQFNYYRLSAGQPITSTLPNLSLVPPPLPRFTVISSSGTDLHLEGECPSAPPGSSMAVRITQSSPNAARLRSTRELRSPHNYPILAYMPITGTHFQNTYTGPWLHIRPGEYFGIEARPFSSEFFPGLANFWPCLLIS